VFLGQEMVNRESTIQYFAIKIINLSSKLKSCEVMSVVVD